MPRGLEAKLQIRLSPTLMARLDAAAKIKTEQSRPGVVITRSDVVRDLLEEHLANIITKGAVES